MFFLFDFRCKEPPCDFKNTKMLRYVTTNTINQQAVKKLLEDQKGDECFELPRHHGYQVYNKHYPGCCNALRTAFYSNFSFFGKRRRAAKNTSSRVVGAHFARHVFHAYHCSRKFECQCKNRFGKRSAAPRTGSVTSQCLKQLNNFLIIQQWVVLDVEVIVAWPDVGVATSIDVLCADRYENPREIVIMELKTGYHQQLEIPRTKNPSKDKGFMTGKAGANISNTLGNHHQLQLWFGYKALEFGHDIKATTAVVLYVFTDHIKAVFGKSWWFGGGTTVEQRNILMKQQLLKI